MLLLLCMSLHPHTLTTASNRLAFPAGCLTRLAAQQRCRARTWPRWATGRVVRRTGSRRAHESLHNAKPALEAPLCPVGAVLYALELFAWCCASGAQGPSFLVVASPPEVFLASNTQQTMAARACAVLSVLCLVGQESLVSSYRLVVPSCPPLVALHLR